MSRAVALGSALALVAVAPEAARAAPAVPPDAATLDAALVRAADWLLARQSPDGAWYSETYGAFKDGWSLTPVVLLALMYAAPRPDLDAAWRRGARFLATAVDAQGRVRPGPVGYSYPTESLALSATVLSMPPAAPHRAARDALVAELRARQLGPAGGFGPTDPETGGWGYGQGRVVRPREGLPPDDPRGANLPATLLAVGALRFAGAPPTDPALRAARDFIVRCQNFGDDARFDDGGFFFSPTGDVTNKAGGAGRDSSGRVRFRSYGSMTADGFRALRHAPGPEDGPRLAAAVAWLHRHFDAERAAGDYAPDRELQRDAVYFYQTWTVAHALMASSPPVIGTRTGPIPWGSALTEALLGRQAPDGHFRNPATDLREDDPVLATALATAALGVVRFHSSGRLSASISMEP
jgi:squalene-hopene/tetraprenyl-beta-curcumene cyclase